MRTFLTLVISALGLALLGLLMTGGTDGGSIAVGAICVAVLIVVGAGWGLYLGAIALSSAWREHKRLELMDRLAALEDYDRRIR